MKTDKTPTQAKEAWVGHPAITRRVKRKLRFHHYGKDRPYTDNSCCLYNNGPQYRRVRNCRSISDLKGSDKNKCCYCRVRSTSAEIGTLPVYRRGIHKEDHHRGSALSIGRSRNYIRAGSTCPFRRAACSTSDLVDTRGHRSKYCEWGCKKNLLACHSTSGRH